MIWQFAQTPLKISGPNLEPYIACHTSAAKDGPQVQLNQQVIITQEQLEQIRQLRGATVYEAPQSERR
jgi:hypothetical protein